MFGSRGDELALQRLDVAGMAYKAHVDAICELGGDRQVGPVLVGHGGDGGQCVVWQVDALTAPQFGSARPSPGDLNLERPAVHCGDGALDLAVVEQDPLTYSDAWELFRQRPSDPAPALVRAVNRSGRGRVNDGQPIADFEHESL